MVAGSRQPVALEITEDALLDADGATSLRASLPARCRLAIDRAIIAGIREDPARQALVAGLVQFGTAHGGRVHGGHR
jgi:EAL domain-containing protein (putative c-di-GMP-specific phosphodiesterase class I)